MAGGCTSLTILGERTVIERFAAQVASAYFRKCLAQSVSHNATIAISQTIILNAAMAQNQTLCT
jgi:hypothetical protein